MNKVAVIIMNLAGFGLFLKNDFSILKKRGYKIKILANTKVGTWNDAQEYYENNDIEVVDVPFDSNKIFSLNNIKSFIFLKRFFKSPDIELIHCHTPICGALARLAAKNLRKKHVKVIYTTHGFAFHSLTSKKSWSIFFRLENMCSKYTDAIITINNEDYVNAKKMKAKNVFKINGVGVDISLYSDVNIDINDFKRKNNIPIDKIMILSIGELSKRKNHSIIVDAISFMENKNDYVYVICGNSIHGDYRRLLLNKAKELGVDLKLVGFQKNIPEWIAASDFGAIPSTREGLGLAGIQSLANGKPLIGSNVQGIKDYVINGYTGYLCNPYNANEFKDAIIKISTMVNTTDKRYISRCKKIAAKFTSEIAYEQMEKIYNIIMEG